MMNTQEEKERTSRMLISSREDCGVSQAELAERVGISRRTIANWESGYSAPSFPELMKWFGALGVNPMRYLLWYRYPELFDGLKLDTNIDTLRQVVVDYFQQATLPELMGLLYIYGGNHGGDPIAAMQMIIADLHTPLYSRVGVCGHIVSNYKMAQALSTDPHPHGFQPDMGILESALKSGMVAATNGMSGYSIK